MADLLFLLVTVAFFAVTAGFVSVCDRVIGPDGDHGDPRGTGELDPADALVASAAPLERGVRR